MAKCEKSLSGIISWFLKNGLLMGNWQIAA